MSSAAVSESIAEFFSGIAVQRNFTRNFAGAAKNSAMPGAKRNKTEMNVEKPETGSPFRAGCYRCS